MMTPVLEREEEALEFVPADSDFNPLVTDKFSDSTDLRFEWRTDNDDCLRWQGNIDHVMGLSQGAFPRTFSAWINALHPDDRDDVLAAIEAQLLRDEMHPLICRACRSDGSVLSWVYSGRVQRDEHGEPVALIVTLGDVVLPDEAGMELRRSIVLGHEGKEQESTSSGVRDDSTRSVPSIQEEVVLQSESQVLVPTPQHSVLSPEPVEQPITDEAARAHSLLRAAAHLNAQLDLQDVCDAICEEAARTIGAPSAVMLFNKARDAFVPTSVRGMPLDYDKRYNPTPRYVYDGHVAEMGTLFLFRDAQATPDLPNDKLYKEVNMRTIGIASLIREGEVLGLLKVYSFVESRDFTPNELALLQGLADIAAQAIANARLLAESKRRLDNLGALREIDKAILGSSDVNLALNVVTEQVVTRLGADACSASLLDPHTRTLSYAVGRGFRTTSARQHEYQLGEGLAGRAALERRLIYVPDLNTPDTSGTNSVAHLNGIASGHTIKSSSYLSIATSEGFEAYYGVPLIAAGRVQGVLEVWHRSPFPFDEEDVEFLETLAGQAAIAVDNAALFRDLQRSNDELTLAYDSTLRGWSGALDLRDKETEGHSERVTRETLRLAREMGVGDGELVHIKRGALLHDIGKMGVPDSILLKPGPLDDEEWAIMKKHPTYALELLSPIHYLRPCLDIPYAHHEKWDGSGYPRGLSGEQIPLSARMFAVVDVWDALCSDRPYRKGWPIARVLHHIKESSGTHFDPAVVEAFLRLHKDECTPWPPPGQEPTPDPHKAPQHKAPQPTSSDHPSWLQSLIRFVLGG